MKQYQSKLYATLTFMLLLAMPIQSQARSTDTTDSLYPLRYEKSTAVPTTITEGHDLSECERSASLSSAPTPTPSRPYKINVLTGHSSGTEALKWW